MINGLLDDFKDEKEKKVIELSSKENLVLRERLKSVIEEKNRLQDRLMHLQQKKLNTKGEAANVIENSKEVIQIKFMLEKNLYEAIGLLKKYAVVDKEVREFLDILKLEEVPSSKSLNEGNTYLNNRLNMSAAKITKLEAYIDVIISGKKLVSSAEKVSKSEEEGFRFIKKVKDNSFQLEKSEFEVKKEESKRRSARSLGELINKRVKTELILTDDIVNFSYPY